MQGEGGNCCDDPPKEGSTDAASTSSMAPNSALCCGLLELGRLGRNQQFVALSGLVFFFYLIYGYVQEYIFRVPGMKPFG